MENVELSLAFTAKEGCRDTWPGLSCGWMMGYLFVRIVNARGDDDSDR